MQISKDYVYGGFVEGEAPSAEYKARALPKLQERMALGGHRLAKIIQDIYGDNQSSEDEVLFL